MCKPLRTLADGVIAVNPQLTANTSQVHVAYNADMHIECHADANPPAIFRWHHNGSLIDARTRRNDVIISMKQSFLTYLRLQLVVYC